MLDKRKDRKRDDRRGIRPFSFGQVADVRRDASSADGVSTMARSKRFAIAPVPLLRSFAHLFA